MKLELLVTRPFVPGAVLVRYAALSSTKRQEVESHKIADGEIDTRRAV